MLKLTDNRFLFGFEGRINRAKYLYAGFASLSCGFVFLTMLAFVIAIFFDARIETIDLDLFGLFRHPSSWPFGATFRKVDPHSADIMRLFFHVLGTPIFIFSLWILTAATIKRLHDRDKAGWWIAVFCIAPLLLGNFADVYSESYAADLLALIAIVLNLWGVIELVFLKGTNGPNRFGPDPLAPVDTRPRWDQQGELEPIPHKASPPAELHVMRGND
jgi:uncharacterized membrane protein YhaH (DUF805 family)